MWDMCVFYFTALNEKKIYRDLDKTMDCTAKSHQISFGTIRFPYISYHLQASAGPTEGRFGSSFAQLKGKMSGSWQKGHQVSKEMMINYEITKHAVATSECIRQRLFHNPWDFGIFSFRLHPKIQQLNEVGLVSL